jgi:exonuclease III
LLNPGNKYEFIHNSSLSKRGVGILINKNLTYSIDETFKDVQENILGIRIKIMDCELWLISIYGPNNNDREFFTTLGRLIDRCSPVPVIIGGDWNTTISTLDSPDNIDTYGMQRPPSAIRSNLLLNICTENLLTDPFRALHPDLRDFTYIPRSGRANRSRLDFFLVSDNLLQFVTKCYIDNSLPCNLFDHKPIFLDCGAPNFNPSKNIFKSTISHPLFDTVVLANVLDTYTNHAVPDTPNLNMIKNNLGILLQSIRNLNDLDWRIEIQNGGNMGNREEIIQQISHQVSLLPDLEMVDNFTLTTDPDIFFEVLCSNLRNEILGFQGWIKKLENAKLNKINSQIEVLKTSYAINAVEISRLEQAATEIRDMKLSSRVSEMKIFENLHSEKPTPIFLTLTKQRSNEKLALIKDDNGNPFNDDALRNEHIVGCTRIGIRKYSQIM